MSTATATAAHQLQAALILAQSPIAIALTTHLPAGVPLWGTAVPAGCRFWQEAASHVFATAPADHELCAIGTYTHNLPSSTAHLADRQAALQVFADLGYVRAEDLPQLPILDRRPRFVVYGPLADFPIDPDLVLLFVRADQTLLLTEASQQVEGGLPPAMGRPACAIIPQVVNSGRAALSLGCCGARAYLDTLTDEVALFALPGANLAAYLERLATLTAANQLLGRFHQLRRLDVAAGQRPTIPQSLERLSQS
jgi:uncharacterized protein (DUF169 family)